MKVLFRIVDYALLGSVATLLISTALFMVWPGNALAYISCGSFVLLLIIGALGKTLDRAGYLGE